MKTLFKILIGLMLTMSIEKGIGQKHILHLTYKPTSCVVIGSTFDFEQYDIEEVMPSIAGFDTYLAPTGQ